MSFLEVKHLRKSFPSPEGGDSLVVDLERFSLKPKSLCGMKGESGSGKTTFLHLLAGILKADEGSIILDGQEVSQLSESARDRLRAESATRPARANRRHPRNHHSRGAAGRRAALRAPPADGRVRHDVVQPPGRELQRLLDSVFGVVGQQGRVDSHQLLWRAEIIVQLL